MKSVPKNGVEINCLHCNKKVVVLIYLIQRGSGKYCSRSCMRKYHAKNRAKVNPYYSFRAFQYKGEDK